MANGYGEVADSKQTDLAAYDACPGFLRLVLANAVTHFSARVMLASYRERQAVFGSERAAIDTIKAISRKDRNNTWCTYGPAHPEASGHFPEARPHPFACWTPVAEGQRA